MRIRDGVTWSIAVLLAALGAAAACGGNSEASKSIRPDDGNAPYDAAAPNDGNAPNDAAGLNDAGEAKAPIGDARLLCTPRRNQARGGFEECAEDIVHRPRVEACGPPFAERPPPLGTCDPSKLGPSDTTTCLSDSQCGERPYGRCDYSPGSPAGPGGCACSYPCASDADCGSGFVCVCGFQPTASPGMPPLPADSGFCAPATCTSDADCSGNFCGTALYVCARVYSCFSARDECRMDEDCPPGKMCRTDRTTGTRSCVDVPVECMFS